MAPTALVTGGTGFIGRRLVEQLLSAGWSVRALVLESEREHLPERSAIDVWVGDITKPDTLRGTMADVDAVFHAAALVDAWTRHPEDYIRVNVDGTGNVVDEAIRASVPRFLFTSSMSGIGVTPGQVMREDSPPGRVFGAYEDSKAQSERLVAKAIRDRDLPAIILIPSVVLGPGDTRNAGRFLLAFINGEFPGTFAEESVIPVVDADDVARAHVLAYERGRVGERYLISGQNIRWGDMIRIASEISGTPIPSRHIGGRALWLASRVGEMTARVTHSAPRMPAWLADFMLTGVSMDNSKSIGELGMTYTPIEHSIRESIGWFQQEGLFKSAQPLQPMVPGGGVPYENAPVSAETSIPPPRPESVQPDRARDRRPKPPED